MPTRLSTASNRRQFLGQAFVASGMTVSARMAWSASATEKYRVAVIGHTGRGNYGHGMEKVWADVPNTQVVAVADADAAGLARTSASLHVPGFRDYRAMLNEVRPDLVAVGPRWLDQHCDMVIASANAGVKGIYLEKPMCRDLEEADKMVAACEQSGTKLAMATQNRYSPRTRIIAELIQSGKLGDVVEIRARGKDDRRGGGEDLWVLGTHMLDLMSLFGGDAQSCYATVHEKGVPITAKHVREGAEGIGPLAGDEVHAMYRLASGVVGYWDSKRNAKGTPSRFGIRIQGTRGVVELYDTGLLPFAAYLPASAWSTARSNQQWLPITSAGIDQPESLPAGGLHEGNVAAVKDLIQAIEQSRQPLANIYEARKTVEMIAAVFESHRLGRAVDIPLRNRKNPLTSWE